MKHTVAILVTALAATAHAQSTPTIADCSTLQAEATRFMEGAANRLLNGTLDSNAARANLRLLEAQSAQTFATNTLKVAELNRCSVDPAFIRAMQYLAMNAQCASELITNPKMAPTCERLKSSLASSH